MTFAEALQQLWGLQERYPPQFELDRITACLALIGNPQYSFPIVHVAGTNGKGSVTAKIAAGLQATGLKVGRYTSPHLCSVRERLAVNGEPITETAFTELFERIPPCATPFEVLTAMAFKYFEEQAVDVAVVEVGLGGRLDATNVVGPLLSVITSIDIDHRELLGETRAEIGAEKAGIIKGGVPVVLGPHAQGIGIEWIAQRAKCPLHLVENVLGSYIAENNRIAHTALMTLGVSCEAIQQGLRVELPGRLERLSDTVTLDVAHNPNGLKRLLEAIEGPFDLLLGASASKDIDGMLKVLRRLNGQLHFVEAPHPRLTDTETLLQAARGLDLPLGSLHGPLERVLPSMTGSRTVIAGSCFLAKAAYEALGIPKAIDPVPCGELLPSAR